MGVHGITCKARAKTATPLTIRRLRRAARRASCAIMHTARAKPHTAHAPSACFRPRPPAPRSARPRRPAATFSARAATLPALAARAASVAAAFFRYAFSGRRPAAPADKKSGRRVPKALSVRFREMVIFLCAESTDACLQLAMPAPVDDVLALQTRRDYGSLQFSRQRWAIFSYLPKPIICFFAAQRHFLTGYKPNGCPAAPCARLFSAKTGRRGRACRFLS